MGVCFACSICGICMSLWAIIQLSFMGYFYSIETPLLIEDVEPHEYKNVDDFMKKCEKNYKIVASNCYHVAYMYIGLLVILVFAMLKSRLMDIKAALKQLDDETFCGPPQMQQQFSVRKI